MLVTVPVKLYGRSHPDPKTLQWWSTFKGHEPYGCQGWKGFRGPLLGPWFQRSDKSKVLANFKDSRASGLSLRGSWLQGYNMSKSSKASKALGRQVSKVKGIQGQL